ncbi:MAG: transcriptional repressor [Deltaproteobacteria bacterium]|nr:transcriptional repressor [Deltaproteobacteria bacterium]MBW2140816.1 transcriptional repressor [Deltaproteobacteria bacterium]MBW2324422.1 transcriptional repressor [Deltaproteobacteria bacterium]
MNAYQKFKMTPQRIAIMNCLGQRNLHPTADEVFQAVRKMLPRISLGTVYRNLEFLTGNGLIKKNEQGGGQRRYEGNLEKHYHIKCTSCGRLEDAPIEPFESLENSLEGLCDYKIFECQVEFEGLCPDCQAKHSSRTNSQAEA